MTHIKGKDKMKHSVLFYLIFLLVGLYIPASYSQPTYEVHMSNDAQISANEIQFDVYILRTGTTPFELAGFQMGITYNTAILNGGTLTASYVASSTDAAIVTSGQKNTTFNTSLTSGLIYIPAVLAPGGAGTGAIISNVAPGTRVGRLSIVNTAAYSHVASNFAWTFSGAPLRPSKISAYISSTNTDITVQSDYINDLTNSPLPVELSTFKSSVNGREVNLTWETKSEINSNRYTIERAAVSTKSSSLTWVSVGTVQAAGSSNLPKQYSFTDKNLQTGKYQYRLNMIDNGGSSKRSQVVETEVALPKNFELSQNYPNPFNPSTRIDYSLPFDSRVTLDVYNITGERIGQIVNEEQTAGYYTINMSSSSLNKSLASGVYIYKMNAVDKSTGNTFTSIKKMMLLK
ncbi:MAG: T9SS type A sorting domain-containing protein [Ignavibacteriaceae bacterium]|nr:T9SS type A sorting domain-containing protein [Ignavibacteriaceae bacterium]